MLYSTSGNHQLENTEALLTAAIRGSQTPSHHVLAGRALVRSRLQRWKAALDDAENAINIQPSVIGYIAKSIAHIGMGERHKAHQACSIASERFSSDGDFILLIKAIIVFTSGEHHDAISRIDDLITKVHRGPACMYLLLGNSQMETSDYETAIQSFERARAHVRYHTSQTLCMISLIFGWKFDEIDVTIEQHLCEALLAAGRTKDAVECVHQMKNNIGNLGEDFRQRFCKKLEHLGDTAVDAQQYDEAIYHYSTALSINPPFPKDIRTKRINAFMAIGSWNQAVDDANEMKHAALHKAGDYDNAVVAFEAMLSKMAQSPDPNVQRQGDRYISTSSTRAEIRKHVQRITKQSPRVLINTATGRLHDRAEREYAFEALPIFNELISSMTMSINYGRIKDEVRRYFRYVMLSHKWEKSEPLFEQVTGITVYGLDESPTHDKLKRFCEIVQETKINWAWSDTCCVNQKDHFVLQEALVAMFEWYEGSEMTFVFLRGVHSSSRRALVKHVWNTRGWTLQEYLASKVIRFYTEDWTLYMNLGERNHKDLSEIISEMEEATRVSSQALMALRPGLNDIREKLRLASTRETFLVEDAAYSLLGIFSTSLPVTYGEGDRALGRLLAQLLTSSGDTSILAWIGKSGNFNSCLPGSISVFNESPTSHIPPAITSDELEKITAGMRTSSLNLTLAMKLYDRLHELRVPSFSGQRMTLPCLVFKLRLASVTQSGSGRIFRAMTDALGVVEITTTEDLSKLDSLILGHPWIDFLLDRQCVGGVNERNDTDIQSSSMGELPLPPGPCSTASAAPQTQVGWFATLALVLGRPATPLPYTASLLPSSEAQMNKQIQALRLVARLKQPWGALLLTQTRRNVEEYKRVAAESLITVQVKEITSALLKKLIDGVRVLDVL
ncbi:TPR-like protein [Imleria badia]|nr:TPR-like protein [Imleria badia]